MVAFLLLLAISAIHPYDWSDFVVEHALTFLIIGGVIAMTWRRPLSNLAWTLILAYLLFHVIGAHYTYTKVPYDTWSKWIFGRSISEAFGWQRNHFDRLVHFLWGLLLLVPMREMCMRWFGLAGFRASIVAISLLATMSAAYEMLEWLFTIVMSPQAAETYNGQQGDLFDAQKDAGLALSGSIIAAIIVAIGGRNEKATQPQTRRRAHGST